MFKQFPYLIDCWLVAVVVVLLKESRRRRSRRTTRMVRYPAMMLMVISLQNLCFKCWISVSHQLIIRSGTVLVYSKNKKVLPKPNRPIGLHWSLLSGHLDTSRSGGTAAAAPPPFRPGNPDLCGSHPLVTPYYCRLGDLLCFVFIVSLLYFLC